MKAAVVTFPGSNCDRDLALAFERAGFEVTRVWHKDSALPAGTDVVGVPGGFSFGDYLRCGAIAAQSPIAAAVQAHAARGGYVLGICNGFQVLTEMRLLPGALMRNAGQTFICRTVPLTVENNQSIFTSGYDAGEVIRIPVAHHDGNFFADEATLDRIAGAGPHQHHHADQATASPHTCGLDIGRGQRRLLRLWLSRGGLATQALEEGRQRHADGVGPGWMEGAQARSLQACRCGALSLGKPSCSTPPTV